MENEKNNLNNRFSWRSWSSIQLLRLSYFLLYLFLIILTGCEPGGELVYSEQAGLVATAHNKSVELNWQEVEGAEYYNIYQSDINTIEKGVAPLEKSQRPPLIISNLENNKTYYFAVTAVTVGGETEIRQIVSSAPKPPPVPPQRIRIAPGSESLTIDWADVVNAKQYNLYLARSPGISFDNIENLSGWMVHKNVKKPFTQTGLINGQAYYVVMTSEDDVGESQMSAEFSSVPTQMYKLSMGEYHNCAIQMDYTLWCWGRNNLGQIGDGSFDLKSTPVKVGADKKWKDISVGTFHTCAITNDEELWCWGDNSNNKIAENLPDKLNAPVNVSTNEKWKAIAAGVDITCGIVSSQEDSLSCRGKKEFLPLFDNLTEQSQKNSGWQTISLSDAYGCASKSESTLWCWGKVKEEYDYSSGSRVKVVNYQRDLLKVNIPDNSFDGGPGKLDWASLSMNSSLEMPEISLNCGLSENGLLGCWSGQYYDFNGQYLLSYNLSWLELTRNIKWNSIAVGYEHLCAVKNDNTLWCGGFSNLKLSEIIDFYYQEFPAQIGQENDWWKVFSKNGSSCVFKLNGSVWCVGKNDYGQLGIMDSGFETEPVEVMGNVNKFSVSGDHACVFVDTNNLTLSCWGANDAAQIGDKTQVNRQLPKLILSYAYVDSLVSTQKNNCIIVDSGGLYCWGAFKYRYTDMQFSPIIFENTYDWKSIALADINRCAIKYDNTLWCMEDFLQIEEYLNNGSTDQLFYRKLSLIETGNSWKTVAAGGNQACAIDLDSQLWCWGVNESGELGSGDGKNHAEPHKVQTDRLWSQIVVGKYHNCGITIEDELWCWGRNNNGQLGDNTVENKNVPARVIATEGWKSVHVNDVRTCAVKTDGTLWCWGLDLPVSIEDTETDLQPVRSPKQIGKRSDWSAVGIGDNFICATNTEKTLYCWGDNTNGALGNGKAWSTEFKQVQFPISKAVLK